MRQHGADELWAGGGSAVRAGGPTALRSTSSTHRAARCTRSRAATGGSYRPRTARSPPPGRVTIIAPTDAATAAAVVGIGHRPQRQDLPRRSRGAPRACPDDHVRSQIMRAATVAVPRKT